MLRRWHWLESNWSLRAAPYIIPVWLAATWVCIWNAESSVNLVELHWPSINWHALHNISTVWRIWTSTHCSSAWILIKLDLPLTWTVCERSTCWILKLILRSLNIDTRNLLLIIVEHVGQNVFGVLKSFSHFGIVAIQRLIQRHCWSLSFFVYICYISVFRIEQNLSVVLEVHLYNLVAESKHYSMFCSHPFFNIHWTRRILEFVCLVKLVSLKKLVFFLRIIILF